MIVDFRKQLDGLNVLIAALDKDPTSDDLFTFINRTGNKIKCANLDGRCFGAKRKKKMHVLSVSVI